MVPFLGEAATVGKAVRRGREALRISALAVDTLGVNGLMHAVEGARAVAGAERAALRSAPDAAALINRLRVPKAIPWRETTAAMDPRLTEIARDVRATQTALTEQGFGRNVAVARVKVNGQIQYLTAANMPGGTHSEEYLYAQIRNLRGDVRLEQLYTERIPCSDYCGPLLSGHFPSLQVYFTTRAKGGQKRAAELMRAYGFAE